MGLEEEFTGCDCYLWLRGDIAVPPAREDCDIVGLFDFARTGDPHRRGFEAMMYLDEHPYIGVDDNHRDVLLKTAFTVDVRSTRASYDIQYGFVERPTHENTSWDRARFEVVGHKWADLSQQDYGVSLLNDCKYGYSVRDNEITLSLLKSAKHPDPEADMGRHLFTYALLPHAGTVTEGGTIEAGCALNTPVRRMPGALREQAARPLLAVDSSNLMVDAVKPCDTDPNAVIFRLHECRGTRSRFTISASRPVLRWAPCDLLENETQQYDPWLLRELLNNCIAHQDYTAGRRIYVDEFEDRIQLSNAGNFLPGDIKPVLEPAYAPPYYRNPLLAQAMVNFKMIDTAAMGIRRVFSIQREKLFPMPGYNLSKMDQVEVTVHGRVLNENYTKVLFENPEIDLETVYLLDKVQKGERISREEANALRKLGLVEGKLPTVLLSLIHV